MSKCYNGRMTDSQIPTKWANSDKMAGTTKRQNGQNDKTNKMDRKVYKERKTNIIVRWVVTKL